MDAPTVLPRRIKLKDDDFQKYFAYKLEAWRKHFLPLLAAVPPGGAGAATRRRRQAAAAAPQGRVAMMLRMRRRHVRCLRARKNKYCRA